MSGFLNANQIEQLFERASEGKMPVETDTLGGRRARWLRTVDFTRPTKFSPDQERRIRRALDKFVENVGTRLVAEHRLGLELEVIDVQQLTFSNAFQLIPDGSAYAVIGTQPHEARMLMTSELALSLVALELMLGGSVDETPPARELTDIDLLLVQRFMSTIVDALSGVWFDTCEVTLQVLGVDTQPEVVQVAAGSEPTLILTMEGRLEKTAATMSLLVPYAAIAPVATAFTRHDEEVLAPDARSTAAVRTGLSHVDVTLRAEVGDVELTLEQVLAVRAGDLLELDATADGQVVLYADRTPVHRGRAGRSGKARAVQITGAVEVAP